MNNNWSSAAQKELIFKLIFYFTLNPPTPDQGIPGTIAGCLYVKVGHTLLNRDCNEERNRNIVIAFTLNWFLWLLCWIPYYLAMYFDLGYTTVNRRDDSGSTWQHEGRERIAMLKDSLIMLYSHLNPLIFLILIKPFQQKVKNLLLLAFCSHVKGFGIAEDHVKGKVVESHSNSCKISSNVKMEQKIVFRKVFMTLSVAATIVFFTATILIILVSLGTEAANQRCVSNFEHMNLKRSLKMKKKIACLTTLSVCQTNTQKCSVEGNMDISVGPFNVVLFSTGIQKRRIPQIVVLT